MIQTLIKHDSSMLLSMVDGMAFQNLRVSSTHLSHQLHLQELLDFHLGHFHNDFLVHHLRHFHRLFDLDM